MLVYHFMFGADWEQGCKAVKAAR
ncbi:MAG: hypothetical protein O3C28_15330 [Proteobacteria bacterium]|nr:hypothetical protein [Pseudomonadota bacterium]